MGRFLIFAGILSILLITGNLRAQVTEENSQNNTSDSLNQPSEKKDAGPFPSHFTFTEIKNGLDILLVRDTTVPLVTLDIAFKSGAITEDSTLNGLNHFYEQLFFQANRNYPSKKAVQKRARQMGTKLHTQTGLERTHFHFTVHKSDLFYGLNFLNACTRHPKLYEGAIEKEKNAVLQALKKIRKKPEFQFSKKLKHELWGPHSSRKEIKGVGNTLNQFSRKEIKHLRERYFYPNNALLVVAGDVKTRKTLRAIRKIFGSWESSGFNIFEKYPVPEFDPLERNQSFLVESEKVDTPGLTFAFHGPDTRGKLKPTYTAILFKELLSMERTKFKQHLIDSGLVYNASFFYQPLHHVGRLGIRLKPKSDQIKKVAEQVTHQVNLWDSLGYFSRGQLEKAKRKLTNKLIYKREKTSQKVHTITYYWASADLPYYATLADSIKAVTLSDIQDFVQNYLVENSYSRGALVSPRQKEKSEVNEVARNTKPIEKYAALYALNSAEISDSADIATVKDIEHIMRLNPEAQLTIHGYTDYTGPSWYNEALSRKRAKSAKDLIVKWDRVSADRIEIIGHGEREKTADKEERQKDRSARFEITFPKKANE